MPKKKGIRRISKKRKIGRRCKKSIRRRGRKIKRARTKWLK